MTNASAYYDRFDKLKGNICTWLDTDFFFKSYNDLDKSQRIEIFTDIKTIVIDVKYSQIDGFLESNYTVLNSKSAPQSTSVVAGDKKTDSHIEVKQVDGDKLADAVFPAEENTEEVNGMRNYLKGVGNVTDFFISNIQTQIELQKEKKGDQALYDNIIKGAKEAREMYLMNVKMITEARNMIKDKSKPNENHK